MPQTPARTFPSITSTEFDRIGPRLVNVIGVRRACEERHPALRAARRAGLMPVSDPHARVASIALAAAAGQFRAAAHDLITHD